MKYWEKIDIITNIIVDDVIFDDGEFHTVFGYDKVEFSELIRNSSLANRHELVRILVANTVGYPHAETFYRRLADAGVTIDDVKKLEDCYLK